MAAFKLGVPKQEMKPNIYYGQGDVITTDPPTGAAVPANFRVTLIISEGVTSCAECTGGGAAVVMPPVCGLTVQKADTLLAEMGITLNPGDVSQASSGSIVSSAPAAGTRFIAYGGPSAREVNVITSAGQAPAPTQSAGSQNTC